MEAGVATGLVMVIHEQRKAAEKELEVRRTQDTHKPKKKKQEQKHNNIGRDWFTNRILFWWTKFCRTKILPPPPSSLHNLFLVLSQPYFLAFPNVS